MSNSGNGIKTAQKRINKPLKEGSSDLLLHSLGEKVQIQE